ncbi:hypothetical protein LCGC14_0606840 [marine sediment metagenome]|uniref:DAC domain-containing protein n=1 Tax=marine sediment metagenome TaxID=412755 RepID=A0A0F9R8Y9_9ZZZZ
MTNNERQFSSKDIPAIVLSEEVKTIALNRYHSLYKTNCIIPDDDFTKLLNDSLVLSQQKVEGRFISTKLFIQGYTDGNFIWPKGVQFIEIQSVLMKNLEIGVLKAYVEIAGDRNTFLVIKVINQGSYRFKLEGFLIFEDSLQAFINNYNPFTISSSIIPVQGSKSKIKDKIGCFYGSMFLSIDHGRIEVSFFNTKFFIVEKGVISEHPDIRNASMQIIDISSNFQKALESVVNERNNTEDEINLSILKFQVSTILVEIMLNTSKARHGSILIFGFEGNPNDLDLFRPGAIKLKVPLGSEFIELTKRTGPTYFSPETEASSKKVKLYKNAIISLSKTDGAMIFNKDLDLVSAGTILKGGESSKVGLGGARRKSAEAFTSKTGTIGIVISQDGKITVLSNEGKKT